MPNYKYLHFPYHKIKHFLPQIGDLLEKQTSAPMDELERDLPRTLFLGHAQKRSTFNGLLRDSVADTHNYAQGEIDSGFVDIAFEQSKKYFDALVLANSANPEREAAQALFSPENKMFLKVGYLDDQSQPCSISIRTTKQNSNDFIIAITKPTTGSYDQRQVYIWGSEACLTDPHQGLSIAARGTDFSRIKEEVLKTLGSQDIALFFSQIFGKTGLNQVFMSSIDKSRENQYPVLANFDEKIAALKTQKSVNRLAQLSSYILEGDIKRKVDEICTSLRKQKEIKVGIYHQVIEVKSHIDKEIKKLKHQYGESIEQVMNKSWPRRLYDHYKAPLISSTLSVAAMVGGALLLTAGGTVFPPLGAAALLLSAIVGIASAIGWSKSANHEKAYRKSYQQAVTNAFEKQEDVIDELYSSRHVIAPNATSMQSSLARAFRDHLDTDILPDSHKTHEIQPTESVWQKDVSDSPKSTASTEFDPLAEEHDIEEDEIASVSIVINPGGRKSS